MASGKMLVSRTYLKKTNVLQTKDKVFPLCQHSPDSAELSGLALLIL